MSADTSFGTLLRRYRVSAGLIQEELAERALVSHRSISDMERGVPHRSRKDTVELLATALDLSTPDHSALVEAAGRRIRHGSSGPCRALW